MVDVKLTAHLADLSKISFTDEELSKMTANMQDIIALMDKISDFTVDSSNPIREGKAFRDLRRDDPKESFPREEIMKNSEEKRGGYFSVMKVVE